MCKRVYELVPLSTGECEIWLQRAGGLKVSRYVTCKNSRDEAVKFVRIRFGHYIIIGE